MMQPTSWIEIINTAGVLGLLVLFLTLFLRGDILPRSIVETIIENTVAKLADRLEDNFKSLSGAIREHDKASEERDRRKL